MIATKPLYFSTHSDKLDINEGNFMNVFSKTILRIKLTLEPYTRFLHVAYVNKMSFLMNAYCLISHSI